MKHLPREPCCTAVYQEGSNLDRIIRKGFSKEGPFRPSPTEWWICQVGINRREGLGLRRVQCQDKHVQSSWGQGEFGYCEEVNKDQHKRSIRNKGVGGEEMRLKNLARTPPCSAVLSAAKDLEFSLCEKRNQWSISSREVIWSHLHCLSLSWLSRTESAVKRQK